MSQHVRPRGRLERPSTFTVWSERVRLQQHAPLTEREEYYTTVRQKNHRGVCMTIVTHLRVKKSQCF